jgi:hypothetical protein
MPPDGVLECPVALPILATGLEFLAALPMKISDCAEVNFACQVRGLQFLRVSALCVLRVSFSHGF